MIKDKGKRIVIKIGSSTLTYENGKPNLKRMEHIARVVSELKNSGNEVVLVSSGAIAVGVNRLGLKKRPSDTKRKQAAAAVGQCDLMSIYDRFFSEYGYVAAQILLNRDVVDHKERKKNVSNTFNTLLKMGAVPIVNENDSVAIEEILFGDNDNLSAIVASLCKADTLIILTDIDGLYDADPRSNPNAKKLDIVKEITDEMLSAAGGTGSNRGTGGMHTKLEAAQYATAKGIDVIITSGEEPEIIYDILDGDTSKCTIFLARKD